MIDPQPGQMVLYDDILPPLLDNSYKMAVSTVVTLNGTQQDLPEKDAFFNVEGPRFGLPASEVAAVFPPRNGHGAFHSSIPQIALGRRTLPWERDLDPENLIGDPIHGPGDPPPPTTKLPWLALLLFQEGEYTLLQNQPLEQVVPIDVFQRLGRPQNVVCDAIEVPLHVLNQVMPSKEELQLLAHVRHVNVNDRELSAGDSDGFFAVLMSNRLPSDGAKCRACLVSLEERSDLVAKDPPPTASLGFVIGFPGAVQPFDRAVELVDVTAPGIIIDPVLLFSARLVLLHSWQFECIGMGTFRELMQRLDVGMIGKVVDPGHPALTDTFHLQLELDDRAGAEEATWYRGPLVPFELTRDTLGPYHSADQARRATPETGGEDLSYAAAFEVGRLLAAADARLAQELMRWRRDAYRQSSRADSVTRVQTDLAIPAAEIDLHAPVVPVVAANAVARVAAGAGRLADPYCLGKISNVIGLNPDAVAQAFRLDSAQQAVAILGGDPGSLGAAVAPPVQTERGITTIDEVAKDAGALQHLTQARTRIVQNTSIKLRGTE